MNEPSGHWHYPETGDRYWVSADEVRVPDPAEYRDRMLAKVTDIYPPQWATSNFLAVEAVLREAADYLEAVADADGDYYAPVGIAVAQDLLRQMADDLK